MSTQLLVGRYQWPHCRGHIDGEGCRRGNWKLPHPHPPRTLSAQVLRSSGLPILMPAGALPHRWPGESQALDPPHVMPLLSRAAPSSSGWRRLRKEQVWGMRGGRPLTALMGKVTLGKTRLPDCPQETGRKRAEGSGSGDPSEVCAADSALPAGPR